MKVAVTLFKTRVSPRFCYAHDMLVAEIEDGRVISSRNVPFHGDSFTERVSQFISLGVNAVLCSGINNHVLRQMLSAGIDVVTNVMGEALEVLELYALGELKPVEDFRPPGRGRRRRRGWGDSGGPGRCRRWEW